MGLFKKPKKISVTEGKGKGEKGENYSISNGQVTNDDGESFEITNSNIEADPTPIRHDGPLTNELIKFSDMIGG